MYYRYRNCDTCRLNRPAKSSHCGVCGHCVRGWDHHCIAIDNCVGRRNFRSFVMYLMVSSFWAFQLIFLATANALALYPTRWYFIVGAIGCFICSAVVSGLSTREINGRMVFIGLMFLLGSALAYIQLYSVKDDSPPKVINLCLSMIEI